MLIERSNLEALEEVLEGRTTGEVTTTVELLRGVYLELKAKDALTIYFEEMANKDAMRVDNLTKTVHKLIKEKNE